MTRKITLEIVHCGYNARLVTADHYNNGQHFRDVVVVIKNSIDVSIAGSIETYLPRMVIGIR